jgi:hypothetical protein
MKVIMVGARDGTGTEHIEFERWKWVRNAG